MIESRVVSRPRVLRKRSEFEAVLRWGIRVASRNFVMCARASGTGYSRLGIIAGRKAAPRAVDRNRGKRLIREAFRACQPFAAYDLTVQLRRDLRGERNSSVRAELRELMAALLRRCAARPAESGSPTAPDHTTIGR